MSLLTNKSNNYYNNYGHNMFEIHNISILLILYTENNIFTGQWLPQKVIKCIYHMLLHGSKHITIIVHQ